LLERRSDEDGGGLPVGGGVTPLVVVDADVLGRRRTGDETYVAELLREAARLDHGLRLAAITRNPSLVPIGVEAVRLPAGSQIARMAFAVPRLLRRLEPQLAHFVHALPLSCPCPAVLTIQDLSFELEPELMTRRDRLVFRTAVPRSVRRAAKILTGTERTRQDLMRVYDTEPERIEVIPYGVDAVFRPAVDGPRGYLLAVGAIEARKDPLAALEAAERVGLPLVVAGPVRDQRIASELRKRGARVVGYVDLDDLAQLYREAACLVFPSRFEGFGLPVLEAMASGTPVVARDEPAVREVAGDAAVLVAEDGLAEGIERALDERASLVAAGLERAARFSWRESARRTVAVYRELLGLG
jgi:glycosyltransferase involved in cell wall biosynthesis